jgi:hypothetical protein
VSVGMSLVFNAASRLEEIASAYAGSNARESLEISSKISSTQGGGPALVRITECHLGHGTLRSMAS